MGTSGEHTLRRASENLSAGRARARTIPGDRTRSVFDGYDIVSPANLQAASRTLAGAACRAGAGHAPAAVALGGSDRSGDVRSARAYRRDPAGRRTSSPLSPRRLSVAGFIGRVAS